MKLALLAEWAAIARIVPCFALAGDARQPARYLFTAVAEDL